METLYLKIKVKKSDKEIELLREEGLFFDKLAETLGIDRNQISEFEINEIKDKND